MGSNRHRLNQRLLASSEPPLTDCLTEHATGATGTVPRWATGRPARRISRNPPQHDRLDGVVEAGSVNRPVLTAFRRIGAALERPLPGLAVKRTQPRQRDPPVPAEAL